MKKLLMVVALFTVLTGCTDRQTLVKTGHLGFDESMTVQNALEGYKYISKWEWSDFETKRGQKIVQFTATPNWQAYEGITVRSIPLDKTMIDAARKKIGNLKHTIQFAVLQDGDSFEVMFSGHENNGKSIPDENLLTEIYADHPASAVSDGIYLSK